MPTYCYRTSCGRLIECEFSLGAAPREVLTRWGIALRDLPSEQKQIGRIVSDDDIVVRRQNEEFMRSHEFKQKEKSGQYIVSDKYTVAGARAGDAKPKDERLLSATEKKLQKFFSETNK